MKMKDGEIIDALINQNFNEDQAEKAKKYIRSKFRSGPRGRKRSHLVIEVDKLTRKELLKTGKVFIYYEALIVKDFISVPKCFKCHNYGHVEKYCKQEARCGHCGRLNHKREDCPDKNWNGIYCISCYLKN